MKLIDRYILSSFIKNLLFGILCFVIIFILVDLFENIDKFIDKNLSTGHIITYYAYFIPEIIKLMVPVAMLLATLFTTGRFNSLSEMTAINSAGISIYRYSLPLLLFGLAFTAASVYFNGWIVPYSNQEKIRIEREQIGKHKTAAIISNFSIQDNEDRILNIKNYSPADRSGESSSLQIFTDRNLSALKIRYDSKRIKWDSLNNQWNLSDVAIRDFDSLGLSGFRFQDTLQIGAASLPVNLKLTPDMVNIKQKSPDELVLTELKNLIDEMKLSGQDVTRAEVDYYSKISFPFANIIVIIFGVSLSLNQRKGSAAVQFGVSILVTFIYLGFVKISQTFGYNGEISPVITAWIANALFFFLGVFNFLRINLRS